MKNSYLYFNYSTICCVSIVLVIMLIYAVISKVLHANIERAYHTLLERFAKEIDALFFPTNDGQSDLPFSQRLEVYYEENISLLKKGQQRVAFQEALLNIMADKKEVICMGRQTASRFSYVEDAIADLKSGNITRQMRGCQQIGSYLYEPAIPLVFQILQTMSSKLQYSALMCLS